jgi:PAS domain-containing protein
MKIYNGPSVMTSEQRLQGAETLPSDEQFFRSIFEQLATGIAISSVEFGRFLRVNRAVCCMIGYSE